MMHGRFCPEIEHAPTTPEGFFVAAALDRWGIWQRAGVTGAIAGMDLAHAMYGAPPECDQSLCERLFVVAEAAFCAAATKGEQERNGDNGQR
jgi:hypothetical protein